MPKPGHLPAKVRQRINAGLADLCRTYRDHIPCGDMEKMMTPHNVKFAEDFILCGREGRASLDLLYEGHPCDKVLVLVWYKHDTGRYEVNAYISI